jgi:tripartite-type tricarboxylate transporter receptor subunit TctC
MKLPRRKFLHLAAGAAALPAVSRVTRAQAYPSRSVRIMVTFPAGGANDFHARLIGQWLSEQLGQPFVVENRGGSGGNVGVAEVVRARPDGYTLLLLTVSHAINASFYTNLTFDLLRDIAPIAPFYRSTYVMLVNRSLPVKTVPEFVAFARAKAGKVNMGSNGIGATGHLAGEMFKIMTGVEMLHVPYRGEAPALTDLIGGQLHVQFASLAASNELIKGGQLRPLAVTAGARWRGLPDVPAVNEFVPGYEVSTWAGMGAPKDTPAAIIDRLNREINAGLTSPLIQAKYADLGTILTISPTEFRKLVADDVAKWAKVIRAANIKPH